MTNEKNELFEAFKRWASRQAKRSTISFAIFCVLAGLCLFSAIIGHMHWLPCIVCCIVFLVVGTLGMIRFHKLANANDAQEFLTNYDKYRKIGNWITIICLLILIAIITMDYIYSKDTKRLIWFGALLALTLIARPWQDPYKIDINRLRELVQQS